MKSKDIYLVTNRFDLSKSRNLIFADTGAMIKSKKNKKAKRKSKYKDLRDKKLTLVGSWLFVPLQK
jgi:hypothetical protein